LLNSKNSGTYF